MEPKEKQPQILWQIHTAALKRNLNVFKDDLINNSLEEKKYIGKKKV